MEQRREKAEFYPEREERIRDQITTLCPPWVAMKPPSFEDKDEEKFLDEPFTDLELDSVLDSVNDRSSPGVDRQDYYIIKKFSPMGRNVLLRIYNGVLKSGSFPKAWNEYVIFFIPKANSIKFLQPPVYAK